MTYTHTYAVMEVSPHTFAEVKARLLEAGYSQAVIEDGDGGEALDMHGVALKDPSQLRRNQSEVEQALVRRLRVLEAEQERLIAENEAFRRRIVGATE